jgi:hypothetical protein
VGNFQKHVDYLILTASIVGADFQEINSISEAKPILDVASEIDFEGTAVEVMLQRFSQQKLS